MTDFIVPADTLARLATIIQNPPADLEPVFKTIRLDNGQVVVSDRTICAVECVGTIPGIAHIVPDPAFIAQCKMEAQFSSNVTIVVNELLNYTVAKTSLGYVTGNIGFFPNGATDYDRWREVVMEAKEIPPKGRGGMFWDAELIAKLAASSPSGRVIFAENVDAYRNTLIRDVTDGYWIGVFSPKQGPGYDAVNPATMPTWMHA